MINLVIFLGGMLAGAIVLTVVLATRSGIGYFKVDPVEPDEGTYSVNVRLEANQNLLKKNFILLRRESQK
ncbi:MAG: hypothetical protein SPJ88_01765 [Bacilli bacterium]|nr:hypothetical protein [Bacilli bacterium]